MRLVAFVLCLVASLTVSAQGYPARPIKVLVPYAAGGLPDTMARLVGQKMGESLGQQLVVENRGGAGGIVGTAEVAKAAPDGYTCWSPTWPRSRSIRIFFRSCRTTRSRSSPASA